MEKYMQENLLFRFREKQNSNIEENSTIHYNLIKGLWETDSGKSVVLDYLKYNLSTTKTATREGIDQSESSQFGQTIITKTRESADQSEISSFGDTLITETREGVDRSEGTNYSFGQTINTRTRESIDNSEISTLDCHPHTTNKINLSELGKTLFTDTREATDRSENSL